uniref:Uncharacterized protein n=1 Tax=Panagrolaimus davidi TaxID=227884 RepID=A0A914QRU7_9BILA
MYIKLRQIDWEMLRNVINGYMERFGNGFRRLHDLMFPWNTPDPYIPDERDEFERELQQQIHDSMKAPARSEASRALLCLLQMVWAFMPYFEEDLSLLDWYCSIVCHFYGFFFISSFIFSYINRRKGVILYFMTHIFMILLGPANFFDGVWWYFNGESLRHPAAYVAWGRYWAFFYGNAFATLMLFFQVLHTALLHYELRRYRKFRDERIMARRIKHHRHLFGG